MMSLHDRFVATLDDLDLPATDVAELVLTELSDADRSVRLTHPTSTRSRRTLLAMAAALVVIMCIAAITPARDAVARWFGIGSTKIEVVPPGAIDTTTPRVDVATTVATTSVATSSETTSSGTRATGDQLPGIKPFSALDSPVAVIDDGAGRGRSYIWTATTELPALGETDTGLTLSVRLATNDLDLKRVGSDVGVEFVTIDLSDGPVIGLWIDGTHELIAAGTERVVLAERVLLWESGGVQFRLESALSRDDAVELAASIRGGTDLLRPG